MSSCEIQLYRILADAYGCLEYSYLGLFIPWIIHTISELYVLWTFHTMDHL